MKHTKSAILLSGSGGNLSQDVAIIDQRIQKNRIQPDPKNTIHSYKSVLSYCNSFGFES